MTSTNCGDSCFTGVFNPQGNNTSVNSSCPFTQGNGTLNLWFDSSSVSFVGPTAPNLKHVYVTLQGVEAYSNAIADQDSAGWQELAPELATHPAQVDLLAHASDSCVTNRMARTVVPAGVYTQIRLRVGANQLAENGVATEQNACGNIGLNCAITTTGEIRSLSFDGAAPDLYIAPDRIADGFFRVVPDQETGLSIEFNPYASLAVPSGDGVKVIPVFTAAPSASCESFAQARNSAN